MTLYEKYYEILRENWERRNVRSGVIQNYEIACKYLKDKGFFELQEEFQFEIFNDEQQDLWFACIGELTEADEKEMLDCIMLYAEMKVFLVSIL